MGCEAQLAGDTTWQIQSQVYVYKFTITYKNGKVGQGDLVLVCDWSLSVAVDMQLFVSSGYDFQHPD